MIHSADSSAAAFVMRSAIMRIAISAAAIASVVASLPASASPSCMTQSEARAKFPNAHLWWHGPNHCWDATPSRTQLSKRIRARESKPAPAEEEKTERATAEEKQADMKRKFEAWQASRWRDAMSKMRPDDIPATSTDGASARAQAGIEPVEPPAPRTNFWDRWVEIAQRAPPIIDRTDGDRAVSSGIAADARVVEPIVTPVRVMLALLMLVLTIGAAELMLRRERRS
jgi:hypothetical protein